MKAILFSGVHGVGKGFFLKKVKNIIPSYNVYSSSTLIERFCNPTDAGYKRVSSVGDNQEVLIRALREAVANDARDFILDGHLCIFNAKGEVERIPKFFFEEIKITEIVLLQDIPEEIYCRIRKRDTVTIGVCDIERMQKEEERYAKELEKELHIRYAVITHGCTDEQFKNLLESLEGVQSE